VTAWPVSHRLPHVIVPNSNQAAKKGFPMETFIQSDWQKTELQVHFFPSCLCYNFTPNNPTSRCIISQVVLVCGSTRSTSSYRESWFRKPRWLYNPFVHHKMS
jgi:hypothetical protein